MHEHIIKGGNKMYEQISNGGNKSMKSLKREVTKV